MKTSQLEFSGDADRQAMIALAHTFPAENLHVVDLPYRLSSWALDHQDNIGLWVNTKGRLLAWAVMQTPFWTIDYAIHPNADKNLHRQLLDWTDHRAHQFLNTPFGRSSWFVTVIANQIDRIHDLEEAGFTSQANVGRDSWSKILLQRLAHMPVADYDLPPRYVIRSLAGESEVEAYVQLHRSVFGSKNMTAEWRLRTLRRSEYRSDLDLVAVTPGGRLAAFCVCWYEKDSEGKPNGQIEPLGVHRDFRHGSETSLLSELHLYN